MASDFYVITSSHKSQEEAQQMAAEKGGWVLISNFYKSLSPNTFAVVRGPFKTQKEADKKMKSLKKSKEYSQAYTKNAGDINLNGIIESKKISSQILAAILGEVQILGEENSGGNNPCEPEEAYTDYSLNYHTLERGVDKSGNDSFKAKRVKLDIGSISQIKSTGEISRMRICAE
jgi:hypothetical protein